jgi:hypothetical protein
MRARRAGELQGERRSSLKAKGKIIINNLKLITVNLKREPGCKKQGTSSLIYDLCLRIYEGGKKQGTGVSRM